VGWAILVPNGVGLRPTHCYHLSRVAPQPRERRSTVSRFRKLSHTIWHCQYHFVWVPKYRCCVLAGPIRREALYEGIQAICGYAGCEVVELNVKPDHVHLIAMVLPKLTISDLMGRVKGQSSIKLFKQFRHLRKKPYWGNHFWSRGYYVDTVGVNAEMIRKYVQFREKKERLEEQLNLGILQPNVGVTPSRPLWWQAHCPSVGAVLKPRPLWAWILY